MTVKLSRLLYLALALPFTCHAFDLPFGIGTNTARWSEEVRQPDGSVLILQREAKRQSFGFPLAHRGRPISHSLSYAPLNLSWSGPWRGELLTFEVIAGQTYLVMWSSSPLDCKDKQPEDLAITILRWTLKGWEEVRQKDAPLGQMHKNLYTTYWDRTSTDDARGFVDLNLKNNDDSNNGYKTLSSYFTHKQSTCEMPLKELRLYRLDKRAPLVEN